MNQLVNVSKIDCYLGSTIDDSALESTEELNSKKSSLSKPKNSKVRIGSGHSQIKNRLIKGSKNADITEESLNDAKDPNNTDRTKFKNRTRYSSNSPFPQNNRRKVGKFSQNAEKSTDAEEDSRAWGLAGKALNQKNSAKATNITNSEAGDSIIMAKGSVSSNEKSKRTNKFSKRGNSVANKKQKNGIKSELLRNKGKL